MHQQHGRILQDDNPQVLQESQKIERSEAVIPSANVAFLTACRDVQCFTTEGCKGSSELSFDALK
jgi:hypothetical protein